MVQKVQLKRTSLSRVQKVIQKVYWFRSFFLRKDRLDVDQRIKI